MTRGPASATLRQMDVPMPPMPPVTYAIRFAMCVAPPSRAGARDGSAQLTTLPQGKRAAGLNPSILRADERAEPGGDLLAPAPAAEGAVMADVGLQEMLLAIRRDSGAQAMRGLGLADAGDVVLAALDGEERRVADG